MISQNSSIPLIQKALQYGTSTAIVDQNGIYSYDQLIQRAELIAFNLLSGKSDLNEARVSFLIPSGFEYVSVQWGIWMAGGIAIPMCESHPVPELEYVVDNAEVGIVIAHADFSDILTPLAEQRNLRCFSLPELYQEKDGKLPEVSESRRAMILYTSGTTSRPKGVVTTHKNITSQITSLIEAWEWSSKDYILNILPLHHVHGIINVLSCSLWIGATCEMLHKFNDEQVWNSFLKETSTLFMAVPTIYVRLARFWDSASTEDQEKMTSACKKMRLMVSGSAALPISMFNKWKEISGHSLLERYGMTEIGMAVSNSYRGERRPGSIGKALPGVILRLVDDEGESIEVEDVPGEIQVKSESVFQEYWKKPEATTEAFSNGWFCTGDVALRERGYYRILGRNSVDIIKSGGYKISALEIEEVLRRHPAVLDCAVVGIEHKEWGEQVAVAIQLRQGEKLTLKQLREWGKKQMATYKVPQTLLIVESLPMNVMGKVTKPQVKQLFKKAVL